MVKLHLVDLNLELVECWQTAFAESPEVEILCADMLEVAHTCVVSPANSYGFMDGGIDYAYYNYFGADIQMKVQEAIARRPEGMLPVGASLLVLTGDKKIPFYLLLRRWKCRVQSGFHIATMPWWRYYERLILLLKRLQMYFVRD